MREVGVLPFLCRYYFCSQLHAATGDTKKLHVSRIMPTATPLPGWVVIGVVAVNGSPSPPVAMDNKSQGMHSLLETDKEPKTCPSSRSCSALSEQMEQVRKLYAPPKRRARVCACLCARIEHLQNQPTIGQHGGIGDCSIGGLTLQ